MKILGIWDGHDSGAALMEGDKILFAVNEERLTRRKLEIAFPKNAIQACLQFTQTPTSAIREIAVATTDPAKTLTRMFPSLKEEYYQMRRRKKGPAKFMAIKKRFKYRFTELPPSSVTRRFSDFFVRRQLKKIGFKNFRLHFTDHHHSHAVTAAFCSGFDTSLIITLDGVGDGLSGSVSVFKNGQLKRIASLCARHSLGIFFEHVTNLMNMRELEDEGKVMALANYAYPIDDASNPMMELIRVKDLTVRCRYDSITMYAVLKQIFWRYPSEQFAYMAQRTLEVKILNLVKNALSATGLNQLCLAGGIFSNVKINRLLRLDSRVKNCFVFPHMGDGGLALGSAMAVNYKLRHISQINMPDLFLGHGYSDDQIETTLQSTGLRFLKSADIVKEAARCIADGSIVMWCQGGMEAGPRALGARSILARPDSLTIKDTLNLRLKKRVWYQPFCPTMLAEDAHAILADYDGVPNPFMTMAYMVRKEQHKRMCGVINVDGSCRPQIVGDENTLFRNLLTVVKTLTGRGIVLNTSLNIHGEPLVCSPADAVQTLSDAGADYLAIGNFMVKP